MMKKKSLSIFFFYLFSFGSLLICANSAKTHNHDFSIQSHTRDVPRYPTDSQRLAHTHTLPPPAPPQKPHCIRSRMEMSHVKVRNSHMVSYNRFESGDDDDDDREEHDQAESDASNINWGDTSGSRHYRIAAVCLTLLCLLLVSAVSVLWFKLNNLAAKNNDLQTRYLYLGHEKEQFQNSNQNLTVERNQLQMTNSDLNRDRDKLQSSYKNLTAENEQLQSSYKQLTVEKEELQSSYKNLTAEKEELQSSYKNLTAENEQLQSSYKNLTAENEQLQSSYKNLTAEKEELQSSYKNLTAEKEELQSSYKNLTAEKEELQSSYKQLTVEKEELQSSYKNVTVEKDWLLTSYNNVTVERDWLQISLNNLTVVRDQDEKKYQKQADDMEKLQTNYSTVETQKKQLQKERDDMRNTFEELAKQAKLGWVYFNSKLYFTSTEKKSWNEARQECKKNGADLVIIKTKEKQAFLLKQVGNDKAWIGLNDRNTEGTWKWVDDTLLDTVFWSPGEPNDSGNEDCAEIWGFAGKEGWNDGKCTSKSKWICEKPSQ